MPQKRRSRCGRLWKAGSPGNRRCRSQRPRPRRSGSACSSWTSSWILTWSAFRISAGGEPGPSPSSPVSGTPRQTPWRQSCCRAWHSAGFLPGSAALSWTASAAKSRGACWKTSSCWRQSLPAPGSRCLFFSFLPGSTAWLSSTRIQYRAESLLSAAAKMRILPGSEIWPTRRSGPGPSTVSAPLRRAVSFTWEETAGRRASAAGTWRST